MLFISEIGINHHGDFDKALRMIDKAKAAGADVAKFQHYDAEKVLGKDCPVLEYAQSCQFSRLQHEKLQRHCHSIGLNYAVSVFDVNDLSWAASISCLMKIASRMNQDDTFILSCIATGLPVIMSIQKPEQRKLTYNLGYMWCVRNYPANPLETLNFRFTEKQGLSSHCPDWLVSWDAYLMGARIFENHIAEDNREQGCDIPSSITFEDHAKLISTVKDHHANLASK